MFAYVRLIRKKLLRVLRTAMTGDGEMHEMMNRRSRCRTTVDQAENGKLRKIKVNDPNQTGPGPTAAGSWNRPHPGPGLKCRMQKGEAQTWGAARGHYWGLRNAEAHRSLRTAETQKLRKGDGMEKCSLIFGYVRLCSLNGKKLFEGRTNEIGLVSLCDSCYTSVVMYSPAPSEAVLHGERDQKAALTAPTLPARAGPIRAHWQPRPLNYPPSAIESATP